MKRSTDHRAGRDRAHPDSGWYQAGFFFFVPTSLSVMVLLASLWRRFVGRAGEVEAERLSEQRSKWTPGMF